MKTTNGISFHLSYFVSCLLSFCCSIGFNNAADIHYALCSVTFQKNFAFTYPCNSEQLSMIYGRPLEAVIVLLLQIIRLSLEMLVSGGSYGCELVILSSVVTKLDVLINQICCLEAESDLRSFCNNELVSGLISEPRALHQLSIGSESTG